MRSVPFLLMLSLAGSALATDGVLEINQACAAAGCFPGDTPGFPVTIDGSVGRSYLLTSDLTLPDEHTGGITIDASDVSIDLNGFAIIGVVTCSGSPLSCAPLGNGAGVRGDQISNPDGILVKNGSVIGMRYGVFLGRQAEVTNIRVRWNRSRGILTGSGSTLSGNTAYENGSSGIDASAASTITRNTAYLNGGTGINAGDGATVSNNTANENGGAGIAVGDGAVVSGNSAYQNGSAGIFAGDGATISGNSAFDNGSDGIRGGTAATISGNSAVTNGGDGIETGSGSTVKGNTLRSNTDFALNLLGSSLSGYRENVISGSAMGVNGGVDSGANVVEGVVTPTP